MPELSVDAFGVAVTRHTAYLPLTAFTDVLLPTERLTSGTGGIPPEYLMVVSAQDATEDDQPDVSALALASIGYPERAQPLFLVRSGPPRDPMVAALAQLVHESGWIGEDVGITHLDELGGTVVFDLLDWAVPEESGATVLICDEPPFADARIGWATFAAVGLRLRRGPGPLRVLGCGEGAPDPRPGAAERRFTGRGPCDSWLALHGALTAGEIVDGDRVLLHTRGPLREGWLSVRAVDTAGLLLAEAVSGTGSPVA